MHMGSQFITAGDLFVEVVDNADASDPPARDEARMAAIKDGSFEDGPYRFDRYNGYNGIRKLYSRYGPAENIFDVAGGSGLNFEFVYDAGGSSFRPRWVDGRPGSAPTPGTLTRLDETTAVLETRVQAPSRVDVQTTFKVVAPCYIDLATVVRPHAGSFTGDWLGLFWACYIRRPETKTTYIRARPREGGASGWTPTLAELPHDPRAFASERESPLLPNEPDPAGRLLHNIRPLRCVEPVMFGRWRNMLVAMMFRTDDHLRFAIQPTGGGLRNPAWDFGIVIKQCQAGASYRWDGRLVFKPDKGESDIWNEYQRWMQDV